MGGSDRALPEPTHDDETVMNGGTQQFGRSACGSTPACGSKERAFGPGWFLARLKPCPSEWGILTVKAVIRLIWRGCAIHVIDDQRVHRDLFRFQFESELFFDSSVERWEVRVRAAFGCVGQVDVERT
jgi:hypothetical protein